MGNSMSTNKLEPSDEHEEDMVLPTRALNNTWSKTLLLPKSSFPNRPIRSDRSRYLDRCSDIHYTWQKSLARIGVQDSSDRFILHDGPPYANGPLHIGHALNKILKDVICRDQVSKGRVVEFIPGWDCHGLPIELNALQELQQRDLPDHPNVSRDGLIRHTARLLATKTVAEQKETFQKWGVMADWDMAWKTMDLSFEISQLKIFASMIENRLIFYQHKPVYWSPSSNTALAESELEYKEDHVSTATFAKFRLAEYSHSLKKAVKKYAIEQPISAVVWTTTPWTLLANKAIAVQEHMEYVIASSQKHGTLLIAKSRVRELERVCGEKFVITSHTFRGVELWSCTYLPLHRQSPLPPFYPVVDADFVTDTSGTGLVHLAPGHGMDDYKICSALKLGITPYAPVDNNGCFKFQDPALMFLNGKSVLGEGNQAIIDHLSRMNVVFGTHKYTHKYPYDWRSKQPVIIRATQQFFADLEPIRDTALNCIERTEFLPETGKKRLESFVRGRSDWCISRQRPWGVPIPVLYRKGTRDPVCNLQVIMHIISTLRQRGTDAWWTDAADDLAWIPDELKGKDHVHTYVRGTDTMDVWFDSGTSWSQVTTRENPDAIADIYIEGTDQHRGWFQSSLLTYLAWHHQTSGNSQSTAPFKQIITHGFTLDEKGKKMSKSLGNVVSPDEIIDATLLSPPKQRKRRGSKTSEALSSEPPMSDYHGLGPDALRLWVASNDFTKDITVGKQAVQSVQDTLIRYRNTFKMLLGNLEDYDPKRDWKYLGHSNIDQMAMTQLQRLKTKVRAFYDKYQYHNGVIEITKFVHTDLSALYIEAVKDRLYLETVDSDRRRRAQSVLWAVLKDLELMLAPITPLLIEEVWHYTPRQLKVAQTYPLRMSWPEKLTESEQKGQARRNLDVEKDIPALQGLNTTVKGLLEKARGEGKIGSSLDAWVSFAVRKEADKGRDAIEWLSKYKEPLEDLLVVSKFDFSYENPIEAIYEADWAFQSHAVIQTRLVNIYGNVHVYQPLQAKCARCWKYKAAKRAEDEPAEQTLCPRCHGVVQREHPKTI
ncbi:isoleucine-tRNA ligase [Bachmanniomyces sp. S44760]|nr:isoleucine-tRNA ligase [Bachmanniomyces sp. S44760]